MIPSSILPSFTFDGDDGLLNYFSQPVTIVQRSWPEDTILMNSKGLNNSVAQLLNIPHSLRPVSIQNGGGKGQIFYLIYMHPLGGHCPYCHNFWANLVSRP